MVQRIPLSGSRGAGLFITVDDDDADVVRQYRWNLFVSTSGVNYARTHVRGPGRPTMSVSELITGKKRLDHRNGDGLDNTRDNLREASSSQNGINTGKYRSRKGRQPSSRFKGVSKHPVNRTWVAHVTYRRNRMYLGSFASDVAAARAYDEAVVRLHGAFARTNVMLGLLPPDTDRGSERLSRQSSSRYRGVGWNRQKQRWNARLWVEGGPKHLGFFAVEEDAARAYDEAAVRLHGERARTNVRLGLLPPLEKGGGSDSLRDPQGRRRREGLFNTDTGKFASTRPLDHITAVKQFRLLEMIEHGKRPTGKPSNLGR